MAKLPALVSALNECDGRDRATLEHIARTVREAGHIPTTKRGSGAADMTAREAVNLFLGANGCDLPKDAPLAIDRFRSLILHRSFTREGVEVEAFKAIADAKNFGVALEALIDGMDQVLAATEDFLRSGYKREDMARALMADLRGGSWRGGLIPFHLDIELSRYAATVKCEVFVAADPESGHVGEWRTEFLAEFRMDRARLGSGFYGTKAFDRSVAVKVTGFTLLKLWAALQNHSEETK